jgi:hypothetical protein
MHIKKNIVSKFIFVFAMGIFTQTVQAQNGISIKGQVTDSSEKKQLQNASINILRAKDSILVGSARADKEGQFNLVAKSEGKYILMVTYPQYADYVDLIELSNGKELNLNTVYLNTKAHLLKEVIVKSTVSAIRIKGDTTEYRADSFHVSPNADVAELLKKMPGIQVNSKGEITAQGEKVNKVLVDGEEFFSDDPAVVTKSIRADIVDKIQVFDKKSDQAAFTGIDDGQKTKTINVQLKEDKKNGYFGKAEIGSDFKQYGNGKLMANAFKGKKKMAAFYTQDNTKFDALNWDESRNYGDGGNTNTEMNEDGGVMISFSSDGDVGDFTGLPQQKSAGLVFGNKWAKSSTNNSAQYQNLIINALGSSYNKTILPDSSFTNITSNKQYSDKKKYKINSINEWGTDTTGLFKLTVKAADVLKNSSTDYSGKTYGETGHIINQSNRITAINEDDKTLATTLSYRQKFAKKGRTISFVSDMNFNDKAQDGSLLSNNQYFNYGGTIIKKDSADQLKKNKQNTSAINSNVVYTEPLGKKTFLIFKYALNIGKNDAERLSFDNTGNPSLSAKPIYSKVIDSLSNHFIFNTINNAGSLNYRFVDKKVNWVLGSGFGTANYQLQDLARNTTRSIAYNNFIPSFVFNYNPKQQRRVTLNYTGKTINPTLLEIQPIIDNSDPLNVNIGNANLQQGFTNRISVNANDFKVLKSRYMYFNASYSNTDNDISNSSNVDALGRRVNQYINVQGNYSYEGSMYYGMDVYKGLQFGVNLSGGFNRYVNKVNGVRNVNDNKSMTYQVNFSFWGDKAVNFYLNMSARDNSTLSSIRPGSATNYWTYQINGNTELKFKKIKTYFNLNIDASLYQKSKVFPNQTDVFILSPSIRKVLGKTDSWELKMYVFDLLNQNTNIQRNISSNFISETNNNGLKRYTVFSLIYNFSKNGKPANMGFSN